MKGEGHSEEKATPLPAAAIPVLDRYAGIFRGRKARLSRARALRAPPKAPLTAAGALSGRVDAGRPPGKRATLKFRARSDAKPVPTFAERALCPQYGLA